MATATLGPRSDGPPPSVVDELAGLDARDPALDRVDQVGPQSGRGHDPVDRADLDRTLDAVDAVELRRQLAELLGAHGGPLRAALRAQALPLPALGGRDPLVECRDARVLARAHVHLAGEDDRGGRRAADHRRVRALERAGLEVVVEEARENDEGADVGAGGDAVRDRAVAVDYRAGIIG